MRFRLFLPLFLSLVVQCGTGVLKGQDVAPRNDPGVRPLVGSAIGKREFRNLPYVSNGHERQRLDLYLPLEKDSLRPLIVWIHGGGWERGSKDNCPARRLVSRGFAVASVGYRLSQHARYPAQIEDCKAAIRWLRARANEYGIDPDRIGVWGASAGGHLVALLGTTGHLRDFDVGENLEQSSRVQCVVDWFGPTDFLRYGEPPRVGLDLPNSVVSRLLGGRVSENLERAKRASPVYFVRSDAAPFLIMQGDMDELVPLQQSELLHETLRKAGAESRLEILRGAGHGNAGFRSLETIQLMSAFFDKHLLQSEVVKR